ncbi:bacteriochlorophyll 4-vinyl reductase [Bosea sp. R86505]|uniref:bacteriochlorophyll 4-vinyl reductase n=1 Tax=Bosea sp. R86505 TaxID=3101710 RepID=UPI00366B0F81
MLSLGLTFDTAAGARAGAGLLGPNAVIQLGAALRAAPGLAGAAERVFARAGCTRLLASAPDEMIDEAIPARLFAALWRELPSAQAAAIAHQAGHRTGAYVLAHRIPAPARWALRRLPPFLAARLLLQAIRRNAWTFAGSGFCSVAPGDPALITISRNPLAMPGGVWHVGVFECLFRALVNEGTQIGHAGDVVAGGPDCRFTIDWRG